MTRHGLRPHRTNILRMVINVKNQLNCNRKLSVFEKCSAMANTSGFCRGLGVLWILVESRLKSSMTKNSRLDSGIWRFLRRIWFHFVPFAAKIAVLVADHTLGLVSRCFLEFSAPCRLLRGFALYVPNRFLIRN